MKKRIKILLLVLAAIFIIMQFVPYGKPVNQFSGEKDLLEVAEIPREVGNLIKNACYDCHSQLTRFPWYSRIAPVSWLVAGDINEGRAHLDFSYWADLTRKKKLKVLDKLSDEVSGGEMPLKIYTLMHTEARLSQSERNKIIKWAEDHAESILEQKEN